jgi:hypothetical protein
MRGRMTCVEDGDVWMLAGTIDEGANLVQLVDGARGGRLTLDLGDITFINSQGVREWIRMQQAAAAKGVRIELLRVAVQIVHQLNIMPAARGVSIVTSFYAPYVCDECDREEVVLLDLRKHAVDIAKQRAPAAPCPECQRPMELGTSPDLYFMFLGC